MTHEQNASFDDRLADYLGGEMTAAERTSFEASISDDPSSAAEVASLSSVVAGLESLPEASDGDTGERRSWNVRVCVRYAAIVTLAFVSGYGVRLGTSGAQEPILAPSEQTSSLDAADSDGPAAASGDIVDAGWRQRAARAYLEHDRHSGFARTVLAITQSSGS